MDPALHLVLRFGFAALFASSFTHKLRDMERFAAIVDAYGLVPKRLVDALSWVVLAGEGLAVVFLLLTPGGSLFGFALSIGLLLVYAIAIGWNLVRGSRVLDCGCGGPASRQPIHVALVFRNLGLASLAGLGFAVPLTRDLGWIDVLTIGAGTVAAGFLYAALEHLAANHATMSRLGEAS